MSLKAWFEFKLQDSWVGVFWKRHKEESIEVADDERTAVMVTNPRCDIWICFVPWFPLHVVWRGRETRSEAMKYIADWAYEHGWENLTFSP